MIKKETKQLIKEARKIVYNNDDYKVAEGDLTEFILYVTIKKTKQEDKYYVLVEFDIEDEIEEMEDANGLVSSIYSVMENLQEHEDYKELDYTGEGDDEE